MDIGRYNFENIESALASIDKEKHPDRYQKLLERKDQLESRLHQINDELSEIMGRKVDVLSEKTKNASVLRGIVTYSFVGAFSILFFFSVFAVFGANTISWNGENVHGLGALLVGLLFSVSFGIVLTTATLIGMGVTYLVSKIP